MQTQNDSIFDKRMAYRKPGKINLIHLP